MSIPLGYAQQAHKKHVVKKKAVVKDSLNDTIVKIDTIKPAEKIVQKPQKKQTAKKKPVVKQIEEVQDTEPPEKDTVKVTFGKNIVNLRTFDGWVLDERNKWIHSPNRIPYTNPDYNNEYYTKYKLGAENIKQINVYEIKIDSAPYIAIMFEQYKGHYRDKLGTDFMYYVGTDYYLIKPEDFQDLWNDTMKMKQPYEVNLKIWYSGLVGYSDIKMRPVYMSGEINKDLRNRKYTDTAVKSYLQFGFRPYQNKAGKHMRFYYGLAYARTGSTVPPFDMSVFKQRFYETDLELFHKFCRPKGLKIIKKKNNSKPVPPKPKQEDDYRHDNRPYED